MRTKLQVHFSEHAKAVSAVSQRFDELQSWINDITEVARNGGTIFVGGNGGSAAQASHFVGELVGAYRNRSRPGIGAYCLNQELSAVSAISNDFGYECVMARELESLARPGDCFLGLTTSGKSPNVLAAIERAKSLEGVGWYVLSSALPENFSGEKRWFATLSPDTPSAQEVHIMILHCLAEMIEEALCDSWA